MLSVVIPARNAADTLPATLDALAHEPVHEVIVVDDGSSDATGAVARAGGATVISLPASGRAVARNRGAAAARADLLAFLDADCVPRVGWAEALSGCLARARIVGGAVRIATTADPSAVERFDVLWRFKQMRAVREGGWSAAANLGVAREVLEQVGGFDEGLRAGDDVDLCIRARRAGFAIGWCPEAEVVHAASRTLREMRQRAVRQGFSSTTLARRFDGEVGRRHWRHPGGIVRGHAALRALAVEPKALDRAERRRMAMLARFDYAGRFAGSLWAEVARRPGAQERSGWGIRSLRGLPARVAWFYFRASRHAVRTGDTHALRAASHPQSIRKLLEVAEGRRNVVEIGTAAGWGAIALTLADARRRVTAYDPTPWPTRPQYLQLVPPETRGRLEIVEALGTDGAKTFSGQPDLVFVDGGHEREVTIGHFQAWRPRLAPGGMIVFHDYGNESWPGVAEAVHELGLTGETPGGSLFVWRS